MKFYEKPEVEVLMFRACEAVAADPANPGDKVIESNLDPFAAI